MVRLKELLQYLLSSISWFLLGCLPNPIVRGLGLGFGHLRRVLRPRERARASMAIDHAFGRGRSQQQRAEIIERAYGVWGQRWVSHHLPEIHRGNFVKKVSLGNLRDLYQARDRHLGVVVVCGPQCHWELTCRLLAYLNLAPTVVMPDLGNRWRARRLRRWFLKQGAKAVRHPSEEEMILGDLRDRGVVCFTSFTGPGERAEKITFFDTELWMDPRPISLALASGAAVLLANTLVLEGGYFLLKLGGALYPDEEAEDAEEHRRVTMALGTELQRQVSFQPEYWPWMETAGPLVLSEGNVQ